jgi:hypothetical protein
MLLIRCAVLTASMIARIYSSLALGAVSSARNGQLSQPVERLSHERHGKYQPAASLARPREVSTVDDIG